MAHKITPYRQLDHKDCGATCLRIICNYYGKKFSTSELIKLTQTNRSGTSVLNLVDAAEKIGFRSLCVKISYEQFIKDVPFPCIVHWQQKHFVVVYKVKKNKVYLSDPAIGFMVYTKQQFIENWIGVHANEFTKQGISLLLEPTSEMEKNIHEVEPNKTLGFRYLLNFIQGYKKLIFQVIIGLFIVSLLQLIFPFLTQSIVDIGIQNKDVDFLNMILLSQLFVFFGRTFVEIIRGWILLHLSARINISLVSDFLIKLMKLPMAFFDVKLTGDIIQRISDHQRIEQLITNQSLNVLFSVINFIVFGFVLAIYNIPVFLIFLFGTLLYFTWISLFMKTRKEIDHKRFSQMSEERMKIMELISGMQEIKMHNAERQKRWGWEMIQIRLFKLQIKSLRLEQVQSQGAEFINELKNILISFFTAKLVIDGQLTLGMMLSVSYIIGQLNGPISQFLGFIYSLQDARISLNRLSEIHNMDDEEQFTGDKGNELPNNINITLDNVSFRYSGSQENVINNISLLIPANKVTAIVGASGSGKTTLMKLLLRFYEPKSGKLLLGNTNLNSFTQYIWREHCGSVMQDGFIFNDTIAQNIAVSDADIDKTKLIKAVETANIREFIEELPLNYNTKIGAEGMGISGGQKQRILIARAIYKNPQFIFFDEATSALDANNEKVIMENLNNFFKGRTAVIIAHRLSTVKNADQIVVMDKGRIIEIGTHRELIDQKGAYFNLVKNQLELEKLDAKTN